MLSCCQELVAILEQVGDELGWIDMYKDWYGIDMVSADLNDYLEIISDLI